MRCALSLVSPQILSTVHTTGKRDYTESYAQTDGRLFVNVTDILHTTHNCNSDTIRFQLTFDFICIAPAVVLLWLPSCILRNTPPSSPFTNLQKLPLMGASGSRCAIKSGKWSSSSDHFKIICKSSSTGHTEHHNKQMITSSHTNIIKLKFYSNVSPVWRTGAWSPHDLVQKYACAPSCTCTFPPEQRSYLPSGRLLWSLVHIAVHFWLFQERYSPARLQRKTAHPTSLEH